MADHYPTTAVGLKGKCLVATPKLKNTMWEESVIFLTDYSKQLGSKGFVINRPSTTSINKLLEQLDMYSTPDFPEAVHLGGPVRERSIAMVHTGEWYSASTTPVTGQISYSWDDFMLEKMCMMDCPREFTMLAGMAQWAPGQLEKELAKGSWLTVDASPELVFLEVKEDIWPEAVKLYSQTMFDEFF